MIELKPADIARCKEISDQHKGPIRRLIEDVAAETGVPVRHILSRKRDAKTSEARQLAMFLAVRAGNSLPKVGDVFGRDHTTVLYGVRAEMQRRAIPLQALENPAKISGPGGVTSATPGPDHRQSDKETAHLASAVITPIPGQNATPEAIAR